MSTGSCLSRHDCWLSWEEENGEELAILNFSDDLIEQLGWNENDTLEWIDNADGSYSIVKQKHGQTTASERTEGQGSERNVDDAQDF